MTRKIASKVFWVLLAILACYLLLASQTTLWDRDEPRFSRATAEMLQSANYLYPTFNGELRADKPSMIYWLMAIPMSILGQTELACRFFSSVGVGLCCLFTYLIAEHLFNRRVALWSILILASSLLVLIEGTLATADGALLGTMTTSLYFFLVKMHRGMEARDLIGMGLFLGLALLLKGPVALLVVLVAFTVLFLNRRMTDRKARNALAMFCATVLGLGLFLAWALPANQATSGEFARLGIGKHVVGRSTQAMEGHGGHFWTYLLYYIPVVLGGFFPWSLHLGGTCSAMIGGRLGGHVNRGVFLGWAIPVLIVMTLVATKLPHYILFIWPAMAIATAATLVAAQESTLNKRDIFWLRSGAWIFGPVALIAAIALILGPRLLPVDDFTVGGPLTGLTLGIGTV